MTQMDGWICILLMFPLGAIYRIQMSPSCKLYIMEETETDALNKNVVQYRGEAGLIEHHLWMKCLTN